MKKTEDEKFRVIATKVRPETDARLQMIARRKGLTKYELMQMVVDTLIRYMDDRHNLTPEMEQAMGIFEHMNGWKGAFNLADPTADPVIQEATYWLTSEGSRGARGVHVGAGFMGQAQQTVNVQQIFERTVELLFPERYRRLRRLMKEMDCASLLELTDRMVELHASDADLAELRQPFEDASRHDWGRDIRWGQRTKSTHHRGIDDRAAQRLINFKTDKTQHTTNDNDT